jgi:hypothetical protein
MQRHGNNGPRRTDMNGKKAIEGPPGARLDVVLLADRDLSIVTFETAPSRVTRESLQQEKPSWIAVHAPLSPFPAAGCVSRAYAGHAIQTERLRPRHRPRRSGTKWVVR